MTLTENVYLDMSEKCDRRTNALLKAIDTLEEIKKALPPPKAWDKYHRRIYEAYQRGMDQIAIEVGSIEEKANGKL